MSNENLSESKTVDQLGKSGLGRLFCGSEELTQAFHSSGMTISWHLIDSHGIFAHHTIVGRRSLAASSAV